MSSFIEIHARTVQTYEKHARAWDQHRPHVFFEKEWLDRFIAALPPRCEILDLGCGAGDPIARYLLAQQFRVTGIDASPTMIDISKSRFPDSDWIVMDMRGLDLAQKFDGIIGWDSFFHLNPNEQRTTLEMLIKHLKVGGALMLTVGDKAGEVLGTVEGDKVYHSSLSSEEYRSILSSAGFPKIEMVLRDKNCGEHSVLLASRFQEQLG